MNRSMKGRAGIKALGLLVIVAVCALAPWAVLPWTVLPPEELAPPRATVFLSQYAWHTRLALPSEDSQHYVEYGFGDWRYYALGERSTWSALRALFLPGDATLSRRTLMLSENGHPAERFGSKRTVALKVPADAMFALRQDLERQWREAAGDPIRVNGLAFRRIDRPYSIIHNSNRQTGHWLETLGCTVNGLPLRANYRVAPAQGGTREWP
ncbi:MAG: DUF2459 domain-containing protein [Opitutales bacterium]